MADGTTLVVVTRSDKSSPASVTSSDAGSPNLGEVTVIYHDSQKQADIIKALEDAKAYILATVVLV